MANMKDIAERAGVSVTTVSKVLNKQGSISPETTDNILRIAHELNYVPNMYARNLKKSETRVLGIITEDLTVFNASPVIDGIGARCEDAGYHYILENLRINKLGIDPKNNEREYNDIVSEAMDFMKSMQVDGIIFLGCHSHSVRSLPEIKGTHFVCAYCSTEDPSVPAIMYDDKKAGLEVAEYLINGGHKNIGIITGPLTSIHTINRLAGYQEALFKNRIPYDPDLTFNGDWHRDCGYELCEDLIRKDVTAIICQNDIMAVGVLDYCAKNDITVGEDIDLIGFDDRDIAKVCRPQLSTVALPLYDIGHKAADIIMDMINGKDEIPTGNILLGCHIVERASTGITQKQLKPIKR